MTFSRTYRPLAETLTVVTSDVLPRICATVVHVLPSLDTCTSASSVSQVADSPPAPALRRVKDRMAFVEPRSTWSHLLVPPEHHLSDKPPETLPLKALSGVSLVLHEESAVAGRRRATLETPPPA